jgi:hypothetical protein
VSLSVLGIAVYRPTAKLGIACGKVSPNQGSCCRSGTASTNWYPA